MEPPLEFGRYELLERIGHGSMGGLYRGRDTLLGREVAVKIMAAGLLGDEAARARFFREAKAAARLQHVNIVTIFEFGEHDETPYIVTEFLRGRSLAERLRQAPAMSLADTLDTAIQLCAGLEAAHAQGVVHRDVKPGNVWICHDGTVKLLDFGIATAASSGATVAEILGSPGYMSPEQVAGRDADERTDIFSAGVVLYEMLSGRHPFEADSPTGVMLKIVNDTAEPIADAQWPRGLASAVRRAMEKSPAARYARASELRRDLKAVKADLPPPTESGTLLIGQTVFHTSPAPPPADSAPGVKLPARLAALRPVRLGRASFMMVVLLVGLATGVVAWSLWPVPQVASGSTTGPAAPGTEGETPGSPSGGATSETTPLPPATLRISSTPSAAKIQVDGHDTGKTTPAEIPVDASRPPAQIQLELPGFQTEFVIVTADALRGGTLDVSLSPRDTAPKVTLLATGEYPFEVMNRQRVLSSASRRHDVVVSGLQSVQLRSDQYFLAQSVRVDRGEGGTVKVSVPPMGTITVYASGPLEDCKVFIDDRIVDAGSLPVTSRPIASGAHRVKLRCSHGDTDAQTLYVRPNQNAATRFPASAPVRPR